MISSLYKFISVTIILFFLTAHVFSQSTKTTLKGIVIDESDLPIPGSTVMILHAADSVLAYFSSTDAQGQFTMKNIPKGDYLINITFLGMAPHYAPITSGVQEEIDLGKIKLVTASKMLSEVQVKADFIPIEITKDTISYNADAYETQPNAVVEDLLKKLPGIEVASDGSIKAQGEDVQKVLVDGKEFFGTDPKMATKNLPARAIKKVKVYDKKSEMADFTGVDDGEREKTIDLQLKEEFKKGLFGTMEAGYGTDSRYKGRAVLNKFSKTSQLSFLGQLNNINEQGFSWSDQMSFSGGGMRGGGGGGEFVYTSSVPSLGGPSNGLSNTGAAGLNYNWFKTKKFSIRSSYFFNSVDNTLIQQSFRQNLSDIPFDDYKNSEDLTDRNAHSFSLYSDIKPDTTQQIEIYGGFGFGNRNAINESILEKSITGGGPLQIRSVTNNDNTSENLNGNGSITYMKRFGANGRSASLNANYRKSNDDNENFLKSINEYFSTGSTEALDQLQLTANESETMGGQFTYTEPLLKRKFLEFSYNYNQTESRYDKRVFDAPETPVFNDSLSNDYSSLFTYHRPGLSFRYNGQTQNINAGLQYQISELSGQLDQAETDINKKYYHFLPRFMWRNDIGNGKSMRLNYNTRVQQPSITQLSPVVDNTDPQRLATGNPDLNAEYSHSLNLNYHSFTQFTSSSFFASVGGSITDNKIVTIRTLDALQREIYSPINIDKESRVNMYSSYGRPFKLIRSRVNLNANFTFTKTKNVVDGELIDLNRWARTGGISFANMNSKVLEYNLGGSWTFTDNYYKSSDALDQNTLLHTYFVDLTLTVWKKWKLQGGYDYNLYVSNEFEENQVLPLFEASISRFILPNDRGQIKLSVFDVFDENRGLSRTSEINYIEELRSNSIGRYAMLSFVYALKGTGAQGMGPAPHMIRK